MYSYGTLHTWRKYKVWTLFIYRYLTHFKYRTEFRYVWTKLKHERPSVWTCFCHCSCAFVCACRSTSLCLHVSSNRCFRVSYFSSWSSSCFSHSVRSFWSFAWLSMCRSSSLLASCSESVFACEILLCMTERNYPYHFFWANQPKADIKFFWWTQCEISKDRCDWHILKGSEKGIKLHCLNQEGETTITLTVDALGLVHLRFYVWGFDYSNHQPHWFCERHLWFF